MNVDLARYSKTAVAAILAGGYALQAALTDSTVTNTEWIGIGVAVLTALGVFIVPNKPAPVEPPVTNDAIAQGLSVAREGYGAPWEGITVQGVPPVAAADADDKRMWALNRTWVAGGHGSTTHAVAANLTDWAARKGLT